MIYLKMMPKRKAEDVLIVLEKEKLKQVVLAQKLKNKEKILKRINKSHKIKVFSQSRKFDFNVFSIIHLNGHNF